MKMNDAITKSVSNAYMKMKAEELTDKQKKHIDKNNNNKIDSHDFKLLRKEDNEVEEGWDDMMKAVKAKSGPQPSGGSGVKKGTRYGGSNQKDEPEVKEKPTAKTKKKPFSEMLQTYKSAGLKSLFEAIEEKAIAEESTNDEFKAELDDTQSKSTGKKKAKVDAVQQEEVEELDEISTKTLAGAAKAASDPDSDYYYGKSHDPQKFADHAKKTKDAKSAAAVQGAADAKSHYPRDNHTQGYDKLASRTPARVTAAGKANKQDTKALKTKLKEEDMDINAINDVRMHTFKERFGDRGNNN